MTPPSVLETGGGGLDVAPVLDRRQVISDLGHTGLKPGTLLQTCYVPYAKDCGTAR